MYASYLSQSPPAFVGTPHPHVSQKRISYYTAGKVSSQGTLPQAKHQASLGQTNHSVHYYTFESTASSKPSTLEMLPDSGTAVSEIISSGAARAPSHVSVGSKAEDKAVIAGSVRG